MKHDSDHRRTRRGATKAAALFLGLGVAFPLAAIASSCAPDLPAPLLDEGCTLNSDCNAPLVCAFQLCHQECQTTRDCPSGERCVAGERPYHVCQLPSEKSCVSTTQCVAGEICAADGQCRDQCAADRDCTPGQVCVGGACAEPSEVSDAGTLVGEPGDAGVGLPCQLSSDCGDAGLVCRQGTCEVQCNQDIDCVPPLGPGGVCVAHQCEPAALSDAGPPDAPPDAPPGYGQGCNLPSDCPSGLKCGNAGQCVYQCDVALDCSVGECCVAHACTAGDACIPEMDGGLGDAGTGDACHACSHNEQCDDGLFCDGEERCYAGCCAPALDTPCNSNSACILDTCDEATRTCGHQTIAGEDADGDGHLAFGCAGGDDCDDGDPTKYTGHVESFDGKDNDCNGFMDDWTSEPKGPAPSLGGYANQSELVMGVPIGGGAGGWMTAQLVFGSTAIAQLYDHDWAPVGAPVTSPEPYGSPFLVGAASEVGSAIFVAVDSDTASLFGTVLKSDGSLAANVLIASGISYTYAPLADVAWGGAGSYIVGWSDNSTGPWQGSYALVGTQGTPPAKLAVPGVTVASGSPVRVAGNGSTLAVAYQKADSTGTVELAVLDQSGSSTGTIDISASTDTSVALLALGATSAGFGGGSNGYVVLWAHDGGTYATFVPQVLSPPPQTKTLVADSTHVPTLARGASDGVGAAFVMNYAGVGVSFGYLSGTQNNPFELSELAAASGIVSIAGGPGGRLGVFYSTAGTLYGREAGYAGLPGADCSVGADCASGVCTAIVLVGPMAYSTCQ